PEQRAVFGLLLDRLHDDRVRVPRDHRRVAQGVVDVLVAVEIPHVRPLRIADVERIGRLELDRAADAAGDHLGGGLPRRASLGGASLVLLHAVGPVRTSYSRVAPRAAASRTLSGVTGSWRGRAPTASAIAAGITPIGGPIGGSPMPRAPKGPRPSPDSRTIVSISGTSVAV